MARATGRETPQEFVARAHVSRGVWAPELKDKVAIVTGAGRLRSIGRPIALELARQGCHVVVTGTGRHPDRYPPDEKAVGWRDIESVADEIRACGVKALAVVSDVTKDADVDALVEQVLDQFGRIDILINNAAAARGDDRMHVVDVDPDVFRHVVDVDLNGLFLISRAVAKALIQQGQGGRIVNISTIGSKLAGAGTGAYASSKAGVNALTHVMAMELAKHQITVNCICPGIVETHRMDDAGREERWDMMLNNIPLGWASDGMDIAYPTVFLCSEMGAWITGQNLNVDGGMAWN